VGVVQPSQERQPSRTGRLPRRVTDRVEDAAAWALTAAALLVLLWAVLGGVGVYTGAAEQARADAQERVPVDAVLVGDPVYGAPGSLALRSAHYVDPAGDHEIAVTVVGRPPAGSTVRAWADQAGRLVAPPLSGAGAVVLGASAAVGIILLGGLVLGATWRGLRWWLDLRNAAEWDREWARVEPEWSRRW
jgi:hypothetical protein